MKKPNCFLLALLTFLMISCKDTSGDYVTNLLTYTQMENAFKDCLSLATETAVEYLCPEDETDYALGYGFYEYQEQTYRIELPTSARGIVDSLTAHGQGALIDSLILHINRAAEASGNSITSAFSTALGNLSYVNHQSYVSSSNTSALTSYFKTQSGNQIRQSLQTPVQVKLNEKNVPAEWNNILSIYYTYNSQPVSIDLNGHITEKIVNAVFTEMAKVEKLVRTDATWQTTESLKLVFGK